MTLGIFTVIIWLADGPAATTPAHHRPSIMRVANSYWADVMEGGTLGSVYVNLNSNSWEIGSSAYSIMGNCTNLNESELIGGYIIGSTPGCSDPVKIFPPTNGGPFFAIGNQAQEAIAPAGIPAMFKNTFAGSWAFLKNGINGDPCVGMHEVVYILAVSYNGCATFGTVGVQWYGGHNAWTWSGAAGTDANV